MIKTSSNPQTQQLVLFKIRLKSKS